jgi:glycosyltransferase involved in cell wall biosynthesis
MIAVAPVSGTTDNNTSLGIVQHSPTQFDEPLYRYMAKETDIRFVVYYYGSDGSTVIKDPEIGRHVGWSTAADHGYDAVFCKGANPFQFARRVVQAKHDIIIICGYNHPHALYTAIVARLNGLPAGLRSDNVLPRDCDRVLYWLIKRLTYPLLFKLYTTGHPVGEQAGRYLTKLGFEKESIFCFPYAVDHQWFARESSNARGDVDKLRAIWHLPPVGKVICGVMKFTEREDPLTLVKAFKVASTQLPELILLLVGDGPLREKVEKIAGEQLGKNILLPGYQNYEMLPSVYAASDLFVHTAAGPWEVSVNEALACGLPVIASDAVGSAQELIIPNKAGCIFKHGDADELAKCIVTVMDNLVLLTRVRETGLKSLEQWGYCATTERLRSAMKYATHRP